MRSTGLFLLVSLILAAQSIASHMLSVPERDLPAPGLRQIPMELGNWKAPGENAMETAVTEYLKPDDYILRDYVNQAGSSPFNVFVAHFKSLQNSYGPHSPRVCLPGTGWLVRSSKIETLQVPGRAEGIPVNEYILEKSGNRILVVYWYQNDRAVWAEEFYAKLRLLPDLLRHGRSDASLIRLITSIRGATAENELANSVEFTRLLFPLLVERLK
jgi:EpsI family protein